MVVLQKLAKNKKFPRKGIDYAATPLVRLIKKIRSLTTPLGTPKTCFFDYQSLIHHKSPTQVRSLTFANLTGAIALCPSIFTFLELKGDRTVYQKVCKVTINFTCRKP